MNFFRKRKPGDSVAVTMPGPQSAMDGVAATPSLVVLHYAPGTEIGYHPDLIARFQMTHQALQKLYASILAATEGNDFVAAQKSLDAFRKTLTGHLLEENVKLYTYLARCLAADPANKDLIGSMKSEMGQIGTTVMTFIKQYAASGITPFNKRQFLDGWGGIGVVLTDRIDREETSLYTMYLPPSAFE